MYVPAHFRPEPEQVNALLATSGASDLITLSSNGMVASTIPFLFDPDRRVLLGHLARNNDQWRDVASPEALVIVRGPDAYISPSWYASKREHGRVVPTWNYEAIHVYGRLVVHDDVEWLRELVTRLTDRHEAGLDGRWHVTDAPDAYINGQLRAIVGVEVEISRIEAKWKMSQNRPAEDQAGVIEALGDHPVADEMRKLS